MKLTVLQQNLKESLSLATHFITSKAQLPILGNVYLKATKTKLLITATNLETSVSTSIGAKIENEGEITVQGKVLYDLISNLRSGNVELEAEGEQLKIQSGSFKSMVVGMNTSDFPKVPDKVLPDNQIKLKSAELVKALNRTSFAVSTDDTRPVLTGILFKFSEKQLSLVATDGFRLSKVDLPFEQKVEVEKFIVPKTILSEVSRFGSEDEVLISYSKTDNQVVFGVGETVFSSRVIEGNFPDFEKIIPKSSSFKIDVDKADFEQAIKLSGVFARDSGNVIRINVKKDKITVLAQSSNSGNQETDVDIKLETEEKLGEEGVIISYNFRFIEEFLKSVEGESLLVELNNSNAAGKFLDPKTSNYLHLIMPIRSNA